MDVIERLRLMACGFASERVTTAQARSAVPTIEAAAAEITTLRDENEKARDAMFRIAATAERCIGESVSEIEDGLVRIVAMCAVTLNAEVGGTCNVCGMGTRYGSRHSRCGEAVMALEAAKDGAYLERNQCVALIARMAIALGLPVAVTKTAIEGWSEDWHGCIYIGLPTGQVSWHFHDNQAHLFDDLPQRSETWDGHDTPEKYRRVRDAFRTPNAKHEPAPD